jgi:hypothetical protein
MTRAASVASSTLPVWTTATRPASPAQGQQGYNTTLAQVDIWDGTYWSSITVTQPVVPTYSVNYLIVAGGGSGGWRHAGGGGAGGYLTSSASLNVGTAYTVTVGAGGAASTSVQTNGSNSVFNSITATGGGGGGHGAVGVNGNNGGNGVNDPNSSSGGSGGRGGNGGAGGPSCQSGHRGGGNGSAGTIKITY